MSKLLTVCRIFVNDFLHSGHRFSTLLHCLMQPKQKKCWQAISPLSSTDDRQITQVSSFSSGPSFASDGFPKKNLDREAEGVRGALLPAASFFRSIAPFCFGNYKDIASAPASTLMWRCAQKTSYQTNRSKEHVVGQCAHTTHPCLGQWPSLCTRVLLTTNGRPFCTRTTSGRRKRKQKQYHQQWDH
jgi:hypothetical protein